MILSDALHSTSYILSSAEIDDAIIEAEADRLTRLKIESVLRSTE